MNLVQLVLACVGCWFPLAEVLPRSISNSQLFSLLVTYSCISYKLVELIGFMAKLPYCLESIIPLLSHNSTGLLVLLVLMSQRAIHISWTIKDLTFLLRHDVINIVQSQTVVCWSCYYGINLLRIAELFRNVRMVHVTNVFMSRILCITLPAVKWNVTVTLNKSIPLWRNLSGFSPFFTVCPSSLRAILT